jgi:L-lactate dehydrogenase complex protein LldG
MSAREKILEAIFMNKPVLSALPDMPEKNHEHTEAATVAFENTLRTIGGTVHRISSLEPIRQHLAEMKRGEEFIVNMISDIGEINSEIKRDSRADFLEPVHTVYLKSGLGVAENGAVWLDETDMHNRLLPFICQHLIILLKKEDIVGTMFDAYRKVQIDRQGFGLFLAGPSKTADIEQSLVIGAHGARSVCIYLINENNDPHDQ